MQLQTIQQDNVPQKTKAMLMAEQAEQEQAVTLQAEQEQAVTLQAEQEQAVTLQAEQAAQADPVDWLQELQIMKATD